MKMLLRSGFIIILINIASYAQMVPHSAPAVWERYRVSAAGVSFLFPKMPVHEDETSPCNELRSARFYVFTDAAVYEFGLYEKLPKNALYKCYETVTPFSESTLQNRLDELTKSELEVLASKTTVGGREANRFASAESTRVVISDLDDRQRWIELAVHHHAGDAPDFDRFLQSVEFSAKSGKEIGAGVESVLADSMPKVLTATPAAKKEPTKATSNSGSGNGPGPGSGLGVSRNAPGSASTVPVKSDRYRTISQPRARYTDAARSANVQGPVRLKITLLASGGVGSVVAVTQLSHGLTENAIAAAKRIVFLPKRVNGISVSVVVTREYTFTIY